MKRSVPLAMLSLAIVSAASLQTFAQPAPAAASEAAAAPVLVDVASVKSSAVRVNGDTWHEFEIVLDVRPGGRPVSGQFVDRVRVTLNLGVEAVGEKGAKTLMFYRSSQEAISLEGGRQTVRFYLPSEVVARDKLRPEPAFRVVELEVGGQPVPPSKAQVSDEFKNLDMVKNFLGKVSSEGAANEGILVPQHLSPFAFDSQRRAPSVIRRESQR
jgi:hypothetical protein